MPNDQPQLSLKTLTGLRARYDNFIGGKWIPPVEGQSFADPRPINGIKLADIARSYAEDMELALDVAYKARDTWGRTPPAERARLLNKIADRIDENLELLAHTETIDNGIGGELENGYYIKPTVFVGHNKMRIFQEEIFGPVLCVTRLKSLDEAIEIGNGTLYGLGAGVWSRNGTTAYRVSREIKAGRVWTNCYHVYPAHAAFGGYKHSGFGRETHKIMMDYYQQTKNQLMSYSPKAMGFF